MNKKGFTLVELLAVIVILAILILLAFPNVIKIMNNAKKSAYQIEEKTMIKAAQNYISEEFLSVINADKITLEELVSKKYFSPIKGKDGKICTGYVSFSGDVDNPSLYSCLSCSDYETENPVCDFGVEAVVD